MDILIYSILRDNEEKMEQFFSQISSFVNNLKNKHNFYISLYENDSKDRTRSIISNHNYEDFIGHSLIFQNKGLPKFGSVVKEERVKNLAIARNIAVTAKDFYKKVDYIIGIDADIRYEAGFVEILLNWEKFGIKDPDMFSGISLRELTIREKLYARKDPQSQVYAVYDTWSTRRTPFEEWGTWKANVDTEPVSNFYCTFNGVCAIKAKPFQEGARYHHFNKRLNKYDLEHAVLAEWFHQNEYNNIYVNQRLFCYHD
jgi:hypothetical protein